MQNCISPIISIVTPAYNVAPFLQTCINSVKNLPSLNIQHIIIDGVSTDGTQRILQENLENGNISFYLSEPDTGIFNAMNKALKYAKGDFIYFLGADDFLYPEFSTLVEKIKDSNTIYYGQCLWGDMILGGAFTPYRLTRECICHHAVIYPKKVFEKYQYNEKYKIGADHLLNIQCWSDKTFKKEYHPILIANFGKGGASEQLEDPLFEKDFSNNIFKFCSFSTYIRFQWRKLKTLLK